jgi:uncharacterized membrane protein YqjE
VTETNNAYREKSLAALAAEMKSELTQFVETRYRMLSNEIGEKVATIRASAPLLVIALALAWAGFLLWTAALVTVVAMAFEGKGGWALAMAIVGFCYLLVAALTAWFAYRQITSAGLKPERTLRVLRQDQAWIQQEARSQL